MLTLDAILYFAAIGLLIIGLGGMLILNNIFRILLALVIFEAGANLLLVLSSFQYGAIAPVLLGEHSDTSTMVDPIPQALVLTAIVIGVGIQALALALIFKVKQNYQTLDLRLMREKMEQDIAAHAKVLPPGSQNQPQVSPPVSPDGRPYETKTAAGASQQ